MAAASMAPSSFMVPSMVWPPWAAPEIGVNKMLLMGRFMALAINWVSSVPAAPTTIPAMIRAGLPRT